MLRRRSIVLTCLIAFCCVSQSQAGLHEFCERVRLDWHRNNAWPQPFIVRDRIAACAPFVTQADNGWYAASTLSDLHFHPETQILTEAGELKVRQIVTQYPEQHRTVFVVMGHTKRDTDTRTDSVQQAVTRIVPDGVLPDVRHVTMAPRPWSAEEINAVERAYRQSRPSPRLPPGSGASP